MMPTAAAVGIIMLGSRYLRVGEVRVPAVVGSDVESASRALRALGFEVSTYRDAVADAEPDQVTSQTPTADTLVRRGRGVALGVHTRPGGEMPTLVGLPQADAEALLSSAQLEATRLSYRHAPQPEGVVLDQRPAPGAALGAQEVSLVLSLGPRPPRLTVPRVIGERVDVAQRRLEGLGFRRVELVPTRLGAAGVNAQHPRAGTRVSASAQVTLYYTVANRQVVAVPSVIGLPLQQAVNRLQTAGLRVGWVSEDSFDPAQPRGVSAVTPADYTLWGTPVTLRTNGNAGDYQAQDPAPPPDSPFTQPDAATGAAPGSVFGPARGQPRPGTQRPGAGAPGTANQALPATGGRDIPITYDPANYSFLQGRAYEFRVEITDDAGERVALNRQMAADEAVQDTVTVYGEAELRMYIDGQIVLAYNPTSP
jgi:beta-lactam-binding protein with PASTA domain